MKGSPKRYGFTLVEILVVIAIVAILASMLFALSGAATGRAKHTVCASNLRQLGTAMHLYAQDYEGLVPPATTDERAYLGSRLVPEEELRDSPRRLREAMHPYVPSDDVWFCPSDRYARQDVLWLGQRHFLTSYSFVPRGDSGLTWPPSLEIGSAEATDKILMSDAVGLPELPRGDFEHEIAVPDNDGAVTSNHSDFMANALGHDLRLTRIPAERAMAQLLPRDRR